VVHIAKLSNGRRVVSSVREVVGYEGAMVLSNEVLAPDQLGRAVPTGRPFQEHTLDALLDAGFDPALFDIPHGGWGW
jgi:pilus assembly protein CpaF